MRPHLGLLGIIGICLPSFDYLDCEFVDLVEVIGGMCDFVRLDVYKIEIFKDRLLKLGLEVKMDESTSEDREEPHSPVPSTDSYRRTERSFFRCTSWQSID
jgi:hypothetical protein